MLLLALAIAPSLAIAVFIYSRDKFEKEPLRYLLICFLLGMLSTLPALFIQVFAQDVRAHDANHSILSYAWFAFGVVALSEEGCKYLVLRGYAYPKPAFNEPFDGVVYAVMISMGFATVENIEYVQRFGLSAVAGRAFLSVPAHASFAVLMGYYVGLAKFNPLRSPWLMLKGLLIAVLFHGSFDFFLFMQQNETITASFSTGLLSFGAFASFYIAVRLAFRTIRMHRSLESDEKENNQTDNRLHDS